MTDKKNYNKPEGKAQPSGLPLLYKQPTVLDAVRHATASIKPSHDFSFARHANSMPLNTIEFIEAAKTYPIVFTNDKFPLPVVILGMEQENYFMQSDGLWEKNVYIPAYVRQYPFIFFEHAEDKRFYLCVDEASPHFSTDKSESVNRLYDENGKPTKLTNNALKFCTAFYQHHIVTRNFCADLQVYKLLKSYKSEVTLASGRKAKLSGFLMIDETALNALPSKAYLSLRDKGWLPFIYFALASTSNWKKLAELEAKHAA